MPNNRWVWIVCSVFLVTLVLSAVAGAVAPKPDYLWWKFDEASGTVAKDSSGNGRDGTIAKATWVTPGAGSLGSCLNFTAGTGTVTNVAAGTGLNGKSAVTFSMWIKASQASVNTDSGFLNCETTPSGNDNQCDMRFDAAGANGGGVQVFKMGVTSTSGLQQYESANNTENTNWTHVCMTWQGGVGIKFYLNGKLDTPTNVQAVNTGTISGNTSFVIGQSGKNSAAPLGWDGYIDDVRVYTTALTASQVADLLLFTSADAASAPSPATAATDVPRDVTLSWTAAASAQKNTVYLGTTFADVNNATVAKPGNVVVSAAQTATTYAPASPLQYGVTYYWRVDETSATGTVTKGDVWSFTAEPYAYPLTPTAATASSAQPGMGPEKTIDGSGLDASGLHGIDPTTMWLSQGTLPNWIQYQFDKVYKLNDMKVWNSNQAIEAFIGFGAKDVKVEYSTDGTTWTAVANVPQFARAPGTPGYAANTTVTLGGVMAKYVKLTITSSWGGLPTTGLSEVRFSYIPVQARAPQPATAATNVSLDATLAWRPGREVASHKVFFGTDQQAVTNGTVAAKTVTDHSFSPSGLLFGATYYWRVDEVNTTTYPGDVWSFTTAQYAVVDDFESYNDDTNRIYDSWIDGLTDGKSGSQVGYNAAPFAEQTIVHGGKQSMPLAYDDSKSPFYSEATRTFAPVQDWTGGGADTLVLYVQGRAPGFLAAADGTYTMGSGGTDIWNTADQFRFAFQSLTGNGTIVAKVLTVVNSGGDVWGKAGVMIRESLAAGSKFAAVYGTTGSGVRYQARLTTDVAAVSDTAVITPEQTALKAPVWVKIERIGSTFNGYYSLDGVKWTAMSWNPQTINMTAATVYIGLAITGHAATQTTTATFSNVATTGNVTGSWQAQSIGVTQSSNDPGQLYVTVLDSAGKSKVVNYPDLTATTTGSWQEWRVPLSQFTAAGVKMSSVKQLVIGVGNRSAPTAGGAGMLYIDDIGYGHPVK